MFVFPFCSRTIGTDCVHLADEGFWMLVVVHIQVISERDEPHIGYSYTCWYGSNSVPLVRESGLGLPLIFICPRGSSCVPLVRQSGLGLPLTFTCPRGSSPVP